MKLSFSNVENKYVVSLSGYNIENSNRKCALQYYDKTDAALKIIPTCTDGTINGSEDSTSKMCIYACKKVELKLSGDQFNKIKYLKWCQGKDDNGVKTCPNKRVFTVKGISKITYYLN